MSNKQKQSKKGKNGKRRQAHHSPVRFIREACGKGSWHWQGLFVPFAQERDALGRLIKNNEPQEIPLSPVLKKQKSEGANQCKLPYTLQTCITADDRSNLIQDQIIHTFELNNPKETKFVDNNKLTMKKQVSGIRQSLKQLFRKSSFSLINNNQAKVHLREPSKIHLREPSKIQNERPSLKIVKSISLRSLPPVLKAKNYSVKKDIVHKKTPQQKFLGSGLFQQKVQFSQNPPKETVEKTNPIANTLNYRLQSFDSYKRWPDLNDNIETNNQLFNTKMHQSKKLACSIKRTIEQI